MADPARRAQTGYGADEPDSSSEEEGEEGEKRLPLWPLLLPFPRLRRGASVVAGPDDQLGVQRRLLAHWARFLWCALFALAYFNSLRQRTDNFDFLAGEVQEVREEFFPDAGKTGERLTESEVTPGFKVALHADDVAKTMVWLQTFCMEKAGSDDHIPWAWRCTLGSVDIGKLHPAPWNIVDNARLNRNEGQSAEEVQLLLKHICTRSFLTKHIVFGDNPEKVVVVVVVVDVDASKVPFGDVEALHKILRKELPNISSTAVAEEFDEYTVLSGNPMIEIIEEGVDASREASAGRIAPRARSLSEEASDDLPTWCYPSSFSVLRLVFIAMQANDWDYDGSLVRKEIEKFLDYIGITDQKVRDDVVKSMDVDQDGVIDYKEALGYFRNHKDVVTNAWGKYMDPICRNHHWGLIHICGPEFINVNFHIENAYTDPESQHAVASRQAYIDVNLRFDATGRHKRKNGHQATTGWYRSYIDIDASIFYGELGDGFLVWGLLTTVLFVLLFLSDWIWTLWCAPAVILTFIVPARRREISSLGEVRSLLQSLIDGRGVRIRLMGPLLVMLENLATAAFLFAVFNSMRDSFAPMVPRVGAVSDGCESVYEDKILTYANQLNSLKNGDVRDDSRLITPVQFITHCLEDEVDIFSALYYEILFDDNRTHGLALFLFLCRLLDICMAFRGTAWIGFTIALAARKLMYFLVLYVLVICCFGAIMEVSFGNNFLQFRSLPQACLALILFTFGQSENAFRGVHPMEEYHSFWVSIYMLVFAIMVITVAMQFFVSIVLDAYNIVQDEKTYLEKDHEEFLKMYTSIAMLFFPRALRDGHDYRRGLRKRSFYHLSQLIHRAWGRAETWSHPRHRGDLELQELPSAPTHAASAPAVGSGASAARQRPRAAGAAVQRGRSRSPGGPEAQPLALRVSEPNARPA